MRLIIAAIAVLAAIPAVAAEKPIVIPDGQAVTAKCVGVHDSDSMTLLVDTPAGKRQSKNPPRRNRCSGTRPAVFQSLEAGVIRHGVR